MNANQAKMLEALTLIARKGEPAPTPKELGKLCGASRSSVDWGVHKLISAGLVEVEQSGVRRRYKVGKKYTGWRDIYPRNQPKPSSNPGNYAFKEITLAVFYTPTQIENRMRKLKKTA